jgi:hypothetical protein
MGEIIECFIAQRGKVLSMRVGNLVILDAERAVRRRYDRTVDVARSELHRLAGVVLAAPPLTLVSLQRGDDRVHVVIGKMCHLDPDVTPEVRYTELRAIDVGIVKGFVMKHPEYHQCSAHMTARLCALRALALYGCAAATYDYQRHAPRPVGSAASSLSFMSESADLGSASDADSDAASRGHNVEHAHRPRGGEGQ